MTPKAPPGTLVGFTGHQDLTSQTEAAIASAIADRLDDLGDVNGICSLAEGGDQVFADCIVAAGGTLTAIVPCVGYERTFEGGALANYERLLKIARRVIRLDFAEPSEEAFWCAGKRVVEEADKLLAAWDGEPAAGLGGTADVVAFARERHKPVEVVWPKGASRA